MKRGRLNSLFIVTIAILVIALISLTSCSENAESSFVFPTFEEPSQPPTEVTVEQLYAEYMVDEAAADARYEGKRLLFNEVEVVKVKRQNYTDSHGDDYLLSLYFITGPVKFKLQDFGIMQNIKEGYVLNIVGECRGLLEGFVIIEDCWVESVIGDIGTGGFVDIY